MLQSILVVGKPHLGTDRLVLMLKQMRHHLLDKLGAQVGTCIQVMDCQLCPTCIQQLHGCCVMLQCDAAVRPDGDQQGGSKDTAAAACIKLDHMLCMMPADPVWDLCGGLGGVAWACDGSEARRWVLPHGSYRFEEKYAGKQKYTVQNPFVHEGAQTLQQRGQGHSTS
jgi:hypothetical protein